MAHRTPTPVAEEQSPTQHRARDIQEGGEQLSERARTRTRTKKPHTHTHSLSVSSHQSVRTAMMLMASSQPLARVSGTCAYAPCHATQSTCTAATVSSVILMEDDGGGVVACCCWCNTGWRSDVPRCWAGRPWDWKGTGTPPPPPRSLQSTRTHTHAHMETRVNDNRLVQQRNQAHTKRLAASAFGCIWLHLLVCVVLCGGCTLPMAFEVRMSRRKLAVSVSPATTARRCSSVIRDTDTTLHSTTAASGKGKGKGEADERDRREGGAGGGLLS